MNRRIFLKGTLAGSAMAAAVGAGLVTPSRVLANWPEDAMLSESVDEALDNLFGSSSMEESGDVELTAPDIAENGAVVPITVETGMDNVESVSIMVEGANSPVAGHYDLASNAHPMISTRIKMGETADVLGVVRANGTTYVARREVKVTVGGCGG
ncbi:MAG: thiosulfate oxidation carrier protein SoxY [Pseudomonadota bacterium]